MAGLGPYWSKSRWSSKTNTHEIMLTGGDGNSGLSEGYVRDKAHGSKNLGTRLYWDAVLGILITCGPDPLHQDELVIYIHTRKESI